MGREQQAGRRAEGMIAGQRLLGIYIQRRPGQLSAVERMDERRLINQAAPGAINQPG